MSDSLVLKAPAKINLHLGIYDGRDSGGYHAAESLMVALDLMNTVEICSGDELRVVCFPDAGIDFEKSTASCAARAMGEAFGREANYTIKLFEEIPSEAGLGGASSNAAAVIRGLCKLWGIDVHDPKVASVARSIGADAAFFLDAVPTLLVDRGDVVQERFELSSEELSALPLVLVRPYGEGVSTRDAYAEFDRDPVAPASPELMCAALREKRLGDVPHLLFNNLEPAALTLMPELEEVHQFLIAEDGVSAVMVTGSGSCSFACCEDEAVAERVAAEAAANALWWTRVAHIIAFSDEDYPAEQ